MEFVRVVAITTAMTDPDAEDPMTRQRVEIAAVFRVFGVSGGED